MSKGGLIVSFRPPRCATISGIGPICVCFVFSLLSSIEAFSVFLLKGMGHSFHTFPFAFFFFLSLFVGRGGKNVPKKQSVRTHKLTLTHSIAREQPWSGRRSGKRPLFLLLLLLRRPLLISSSLPAAVFDRRRWQNTSSLSPSRSLSGPARPGVPYRASGSRSGLRTGVEIDCWMSSCPRAKQGGSEERSSPGGGGSFFFSLCQCNSANVFCLLLLSLSHSAALYLTTMTIAEISFLSLCIAARIRSKRPTSEESLSAIKKD